MSWISRGIPKEGDLLFTTEAPLGNVAILPKYDKVVVAQRVICLSPKKSCDTSFYKWYLLSNVFQNELNKRATGSTALGIRSKELAIIQLPYPPLPVQQKIAAILDAADAYRQKTKALIDKYDQLAQSLFLDMFGDPVRNEKGWSTNVVENILCTKTQNGHYVPKEQYSPDGIAMVHMSDAFYGKVKLDNIKRVKVSFTEAQKYNLKETDILIARRSLNYEGAAKPCLVPKIKEPLIYESSLIRLSPDLEKINTIFLYFYFSNENARKAHILQYVTKSTISGINNKDLNKINIYTPPIDLQNLFAERIQLIEAQKQQAQASLQKAEELFNSLLQRAFKGELVN